MSEERIENYKSEENILEEELELHVIKGKTYKQRKQEKLDKQRKYKTEVIIKEVGR